MTRSAWSLQDAKNRLSELVRAADREPQIVTKHGKPAVVMVAAEEYARLQRLDRLRAPSFAEHVLAMPVDDGVFDRLDGRLRDSGL
jgi:prevent-host-death family protein